MVNFLGPNLAESREVIPMQATTGDSEAYEVFGHGVGRSLDMYQQWEHAL